MAVAGERLGIGIKRHFTTEGRHPYDEVVWEHRDSRISDYRTGAVAFEQLGVEVPSTWSLNATNILAQKYFRGTVGVPGRESSLRQVVDRVVDTITAWGAKDGYFVDAAEAATFSDELKHLIVMQKAAFNSPVWFNIGVAGVPQQAAACQPYDALVSTPEGLVPIGRLVEEGAVGEKVFDANGLTRIEAVKANGRKHVLRVTTKSGHKLEVTGDHLVWRAGGPDSGRFVPAAELKVGDELSWYDTESGSSQALEIGSIEDVGEMDVFDIQTESGEYLSSGLRVHNCFILGVEDSMASILNWYVEEGTIFKGGSGAGVNLSNIRSSRELLNGGGTASGPVSFMRGADASAGTIKSGGKTRRAAKMVILDADHPDIKEFVWCKAREERKARVLAQAGFDMDLDGRDSQSVQYQNANNSVRVTDEFMQAVLEGGDWDLVGRTSDQVVETVKARDLFRQIAEAAWECADPGLQFDTTINKWHTAPNTGRISASNPCSEYVHLDNSSCNLASLNLMRFLNDDDTFDVEGFEAAVAVVFTAQEILIGNADYPTDKIGDTTRKFRQLGLGYANLGAMLMALGVPYDSDEGRAIAASITALMTGAAYVTSAQTAARMGPFAGFHENSRPMLDVLRMHRREVAKIDEEKVPTELLGAAQEAWDTAVELAESHGVRNSQATVLAPTGTISFLMDCDTTGIEPDLGLVKTKKLVGGGTMSIVNQTVPRALKRLGYSADGGGGDRRLHRRAQDHRRRPDSAAGRSSGLRLFDGRQHDPLPRSREDDGGGPALHLGCHLEDGEPPRGRNGRRHRGAAHRRLEDGPESGRHLPRQLQGRPAARHHQAGIGRRRGKHDRRRHEVRLARPGGGAARAHLRARGRPSGKARRGARDDDSHPAAPQAPLQHVRLPRRRLRGLRDRRRVRGRPARRGLHEGLQAGLDPVRGHGRLLDRRQPRTSARGPAVDVRAQVHEYPFRARRDH